MAEFLADRILETVAQAARLYHRLVIVAAPRAGGKTSALQDVQQRIGADLLNANLELSRRMLDLTERQRGLRLPQLLSEIVDASKGNVILLDNTEILFDVVLRQDPMRLLQAVSRNKTVVAAWSGCAESGYLTYAAPEHVEYRRYPTRDLLVVVPEQHN